MTMPLISLDPRDAEYIRNSRADASVKPRMSTMPVNTTAPERSAPAPARYVATWGEGYSPNPGETTTQEVGLDFFHPDNGYGLYDIGRVATLRVGDDADLSDPCGQHWIRRIA